LFIHDGRSPDESRGGRGGCEREYFDASAAREVPAGLGEENSGVASITGESGVE
jgi:hypothetical protein